MLFSHLYIFPILQLHRLHIHDTFYMVMSYVHAVPTVEICFWPYLSTLILDNFFDFDFDLSILKAALDKMLYESILFYF